MSLPVLKRIRGQTVELSSVVDMMPLERRSRVAVAVVAVVKTVVGSKSCKGRKDIEVIEKAGVHRCQLRYLKSQVDRLEDRQSWA
jgi:hypothetical protein